MTTATQLAGKVGPGMVDIVPPTDPYLRAALMEQLDQSGMVVLRVRKDLDQFHARDHRYHAAGLAQYAADKTVSVVVDRPVAQTRFGNRDQPKMVKVTEDGVSFRPKTAVSLLDRYPTLVEEAPSGEHSIPLSTDEKLAAAESDNADLHARLARLEKLLATEAASEDEAPPEAPAAPETKKRRT